MKLSIDTYCTTSFTSQSCENEENRKLTGEGHIHTTARPYVSPRGLHLATLRYFRIFIRE